MVPGRAGVGSDRDAQAVGRVERPRLRRRRGRAGVPLRPGEADRRVQPPRREPEQPTLPGRRQHEHQLAANPDADPDRRGPRSLAARPDHRDALRRTPGARRARLLVEHPAGRRDPRVDRDPRPARRPRAPARPATAAGDPVDDTGLSNGEPRGGGHAGVGPLVEQTVRSVLEQHIASVTREALDRRAPGLLDSERIEQLAVQAAERQLAELADPPGLYYLTLEEWVGEWLFPVYRRSVLGHDRVWCPQWWRHAEAVARLESLWRAWEHLRQDAAVGLSVWFRDHADHHMTVLLDADGPFKGCDGRHSDRPVDELPHDPPPDGMFEPDELTDASVPNGRASAQAPARNAGGPREHTIRHSR